MTEEATPSMPTVVGTTRPRFEGVEPRPSNEVGFRRSSDEPDDEAKSDELKQEPEALASALVAPKTPVAAEPEAETALVVADQGTQRKKILPHLEVDYSQYEGKFASYPRIDPNINLRSVQDEAVETYISEMETGRNRRVIISLPTGCGKTVTGLSITGRINGRVLWIAHRDELIEQPAKEIERHFPGLEFGIEKASQKEGVAKRVVISSIQTLSRKNRLLRILQGAPFSIIVYDECHHATSVQAMRVLSWLGCFREDGKGPRLLGLTATIERSDKTSLGHVFQDLIYSLSIQEAIKLGFLVPPKSIKVYLPMRLKKGSDGDISISDAEREAKRLNVAQANATNIKLHCGERKTIVFTTSVDQAKRTAEACQRLGIKAEWVSGQPYMNKTDRKEAIKRFADGEIQVLACSDVLCLDQETEILTREGWVGIDQMTPEHRVANWRDGEIFFAKPKEIYRRSRSPNEGMVSLPSSRCSIRVTDRHAMVWRTIGAKKWQKSEVMELVSTKASSAIELPVSGLCAPEKFVVARAEKTEAETKRLISAGAFNLRKREGYDWSSSFAEAERRVTRRYVELRHKAPDELTQDECMLIGLWIADGGKNVLARGGVEYTISQGTGWPILVEWIEERLKAVGVDYKKRMSTEGNAWLFAMPRGTGGGSQQRNGVFAFEPYLDKNGSDMLWGLNERQFDALLFGFWVGDGTHGKGDKKPKEGFRATITNAVLADRLQAIATCRGYRTALRRHKNGVSRIDGRQHYTHTLSWRKAETHRVDGRFNRHKSAQSKKFERETEWRDELVWCVKSDSGSIVTRRHGHVVVVGNCEGYDERSIGAVVIARPTLSKSRWLQMAGRGLRTHAHKVDCLLIDIACSEHELVTADILLEPPEEKIKRNPRRREEAPLDSNTEWKRLQSYLRSARIDTIEHGEITFARASDDLIVTVAKDSQLVILRRVNPDGSDAWVIEHKGLVYTMEPLTLQEAMSVCDSLLPSFGGSAKPDSPEWEKATESPTPPPGLMPGTQSNETTQIVDPRVQLPLAMKFATGSDPADLVEQVNNDIMNANSAAFARGLRLAFEKKACHLLALDKGTPPDRHKWGWTAQKTKVAVDASVKEANGPMIGWVYGDLVCVEPSLSVKIAEEALKAAGEKDVDIKTSYLRTHLGTVNRTFKDMRRDWIKVKTKDVEPIPEKAD